MSSSIGIITRAVLHPCADAGPELWVQCAYPAALRAIYSLLPFDAKHGIHALEEKSWLKYGGEALQDAEIELPEFIDKGITFMFKFGRLVDIAAWWMFLASVGIDFLAEWTSMVWEQAGCEIKPGSDHFYANAPFGAFTDSGSWEPVAAWHERYPSPGAIDGSVMLIPPHSTGSLACAVSPDPIFGGLIPFSIRIRDATADHVLKQTDTDGSDIFGSNAAVLETPFSTDDVPHVVVAEVFCATRNDGHAHVVGFNGGSLSATWSTKG